MSGISCSKKWFRPAWQRFDSFLVLTTLLLFWGCTPTGQNLLLAETPPLLYDDGDFATLNTSINYQLHYLDTLPDDFSIDVDGKSYSVAWLSESLKTFQEIIELEPSPLELDRILRENFTLYQAGGRKKSPGEILLTGYYVPVLQGSLERNPPFIFPIYSTPGNLVERITLDGVKKIGRIDNGGAFQPYWTREEIDTDNMAEGFELAYLKDLFDVFLLHVQGSGILKLPDGTYKSVHYRTNNGHPYSSIGKLLVDENILALEDVDIPAIRRYFLNNPLDEQRVLNHNHRYIFFEWGTDGQPKGSIGEPLTPGRSIAIDKKALPQGMIGYLISQKPVTDENGNITSWVPLQRFVLPQDAGSAIQGPGRVDLFWGNGKYAEIAAGAMKEKGYLYFLVKNDFEVSSKNDE